MNKPNAPLFILPLCLLGAACSGSTMAPDAGSTDSGSPADSGSGSADSGPSDAGSSGQATVDPSLFVPGGLSGSIETVPCTLSGGTQSTCYEITILGAPADHAVGPFCPRNISDGADVAGIWIENGQTYDLTGAFIENLATFYSDANWQLYDSATGDINVTDTQVACEAAARPNVDPQYQNHCVECDLAYVGGGVSETFLIPVTPVPLASTAEIDRRSSVGLALNGVRFDPPAPVDAILGAYTIAAFDDCGGHINPFAGYHYHGATGCPTEVDSGDGHAPLIGYAMDGYGIHAMLDGDGTEPDDLDVCRGHSDAERGYHYHVASAGENMFIGCFRGEQGSIQ